MKPDALDPVDAEERGVVVVLQPAEVALDSATASVQVAPPGHVPVAGGARIEQSFIVRFRREEPTLNEQLLEEAGLDQPIEADAAVIHTRRAVGGNSAQGVPAAAVDRGEWEAGDYWDVLTGAEDDSLTEDCYEFATLPDGDLIVDEKCDETLASLADAVEEELRPPYRAVAVRQGARVWSVSARRIQVEPLGLTDGDQLTLSSSGGQRRLEIDGLTVTNLEVVATLERFAPETTDEYIVEGRRLDEGLWEVRLRPSDQAENPDGQPVIEATNEAARFIASNGGGLYLWLDAAGMLHTKTAPPEHPVDFDRIDADGFTVYQDTSIKSPGLWRLVLHHAPPRIEALWDGHDRLPRTQER